MFEIECTSYFLNLFPDENTDVRITANETPRRLLREMPVGSPGNTDEKIVHQS